MYICITCLSIHSIKFNYSIFLELRLPLVLLEGLLTSIFFEFFSLKVVRSQQGGGGAVTLARSTEIRVNILFRDSPA